MDGGGGGEDPACLANAEKRKRSYDPSAGAKAFRAVSTLTSRKFSLSVVKAVGGVRRPVIMVSRRKFLLYEARRESSKVVWWRRRLVERRWLLVGGKGSSEMWRSL